MNEFRLNAAKSVWAIGFDFENQAREDGFRLIAGVDEVGRGCLAGPVVAAACILDPERPVPEGLNDSKKLTHEEREKLYTLFEEHNLPEALSLAFEGGTSGSLEVSTHAGIAGELNLRKGEVWHAKAPALFTEDSDAFFWISTKGPMNASSPISQP